MKKKLLLVTFPVDLGNSTFEKRFIQLFENDTDLKVYRFLPNQKFPDTFLKYAATIGRRFLTSFELQRVVREANREGRQVLFHGISPALFAYPALKRGSSCIVTDWTRKLYDPLTGNKMSPSWLTAIHRQVLKTQKYVIGITDAVLAEIAQDYGIAKDKLRKGRLPFAPDLEMFQPSPNRDDNMIKILFVGGDFDRKGGDLLLDWFNRQQNKHLQMTMVTGHPVGNHPGVQVESNVQYGQPKHVELYKSHDILVLPTKCDSYPSVLGEAACSGLAVLTTDKALGAPEIIENGGNGFICSEQQDLLEQLDTLIQDKVLIEAMKSRSRALMEERFSAERVLSDYTSCLFDE